LCPYRKRSRPPQTRGGQTCAHPVKCPADHLRTARPQFAIKAGTMVTIDGKNHKRPSAPSWISTKGITPR